MEPVSDLRDGRARAQPQGEERAAGHRPAGVLEQVLGHLAAGDDRVAPVVEPDQLRQQLGAQPVAVAPGAVDGQLHQATLRTEPPTAADSSGSKTWRAEARSPT